MKKQISKKQHKIYFRFKYQLIKVDKNMDLQTGPNGLCRHSESKTL